MSFFKKFITVLFVSSILISSCDLEEDDEDTDTCDTYTDQVAKGNFKGRDFTVQGGTATTGVVGGEYFCRIFVSPIESGETCDFPHFGGDEGVILFSLSNLDPQNLNFSDLSDAEHTLNFNTRENNVTEIELASCGKMEIFQNNGNTITGRVIAEGQNGSTIDGNFTLVICQ